MRLPKAPYPKTFVSNVKVLVQFQLQLPTVPVLFPLMLQFPQRQTQCLAQFSENLARTSSPNLHPLLVLFSRIWSLPQSNAY